MSIDGNEETIARLIRLAPPRTPIPQETAQRVRAAVHEEWWNLTRQRRRFRIGVIAAIAASLLIAVVVFRRPVPPSAGEATTVIAATVESTTGTFVAASRSAAAGAPLHVGVIAETESGSTASLSWRGAALRLDQSTRVRIDSARAISLERGALYFASNGTRTHILVRTPYGTVADVGTQFEVRLEPAALRVRVREGRIDLSRGAMVVRAGTGTELMAEASGVGRRPIATSGPEWEWILHAAPPFRLEGLTVAAVASHYAREAGLQVRYATTIPAKALHGDVLLAPNEALDAAMQATGLRYRIDGQTLTVSGRS